jgi:hypothetical protein
VLRDDDSDDDGHVLDEEGSAWEGRFWRTSGNVEPPRFESWIARSFPSLIISFHLVAISALKAEFFLEALFQDVLLCAYTVK